MRNAIVGGIGTLWGAAILLYSFFGSRPQREGAYAAGQIAGTVFGLLMFGAGLYYLIVGIRSMTVNDQNQKPKRRKRPRQERKLD